MSDDSRFAECRLPDQTGSSCKNRSYLAYLPRNRGHPWYHIILHCKYLLVLFYIVSNGVFY